MSPDLDEVDFKLISSLARDARSTTTQIAADARISRPTAIKKLRKLTRNKVVSLGARVNLTKLGFKLALITFKTQGNRKELKTSLFLCPRVLMLIETGGNPHYLALLYGENTETLVSTIECMKSISGMEIVSWHRLKPPILPETFALQVFPTKNEVAPCCKKCAICSNYQNKECLGCPAVTEYKGFL